VEQDDIELLVNLTIQNLEPQFFKPLSNEYYYQSLTLAAIDAVFSARARYQSVQAVVERYCQRYNLDRYRNQKEYLPSLDSQEHISSLIQKLEQAGTSYFAERVFRNKSKTSRRLKADVLLDLLRVVRDCGIQTFQEIQPILSDTDKQDDLLHKLIEIHGIGEATSRYFLMLAGNDQMVKPDTMILRFIRNALGKTVGSVEAVHLIQATSECLSKSYPHISPRRLDHLIWYWQRAQASFETTCISDGKLRPFPIRQQPIPVSNNSNLTIAQKIQESMHLRYRVGELLSRAQIKKDVLTDYQNISPGSVMPSDYCCNKWNKDARSGIYHIFFYEKKDTYRLLPRVDVTKPRERGVCQETF